MTKTNWFATGVCILCSVFVHAQQGLIGEYYDGTNFDRKVMTRTDAKISFVWNNVAPAQGMNPAEFSVRWTGQIQAPESGNYLFRAHVDDGIRVMVDHKMVINAWGMHDSEPFSGSVYLEAGRLYNLQVDYFNGLFEGEIQLYWQLPSEKPIFGGLLGYNDKIIDSKYFYKPVPEIPQPQVTVSTAKPVPPPKKTVNATPEQNPVAQKPPVTKPQPSKPAEIHADTLEKYIPKNILFVQSKSIMLAASKPQLDQLAGYLVRNPSVKLTIEGHTDNHGDSAKNMVLSKERARVVADYLIDKGVATKRISAEGYGDTRPLQNKKVATGNAQNRRVEFKLNY